MHIHYNIVQQLVPTHCLYFLLSLGPSFCIIPCLVQRQWNSLFLPPVLVPQPHRCYREEYLTTCKLPGKNKGRVKRFLLSLNSQSPGGHYIQPKHWPSWSE